MKQLKIGKSFVAFVVFCSRRWLFGKRPGCVRNANGQHRCVRIRTSKKLHWPILGHCPVLVYKNGVTFDKNVGLGHGGMFSKAPIVSECKVMFDQIEMAHFGIGKGCANKKNQNHGRLGLYTTTDGVKCLPNVFMMSIYPIIICK